MVLGGGQGGAFGATLDGISVNTNRNAEVVETAFLTPSVEAITEFSVETNGFKPEFGQAGGGAITFASKSGTNQFHGSLYDFLRNDALDEKGFFEQRKGIYRQNNFGASLGGPVKIPNVYNGTNRTFFFVAYEGFMNDQASNAMTLSVPTPEMYNGDFSNWVDANGRMIVVYDPATTRPNPSGTGFIRDPFPGNRIPANRFSTVANQFLALARGTVVPNRDGLVPGTQAYVTNNYLSPGGTTVEKTNKFSLKLDHTLSDRHRVSYLFNRTSNRVKPGDSGPAGLPLPFNTFQSTSFDGDLHRASWDWIGQRMVNHFSFGVNTFYKDAFSPNVGQGWQDRDLHPQCGGLQRQLRHRHLHRVLAVGRAVQQRNRAAAARGEGRLHAQPRGRTPSRPASPSIASRPTASASRISAAGRASRSGERPFLRPTTLATGGGNSFASFLLGVADSGRTETIRYLQQVYSYYWFYAQDDWRLNDKLVLQLRPALRVHEPTGGRRRSVLRLLADESESGGQQLSGRAHLRRRRPGREGTRSLVPGYYGAWGPRVSAAYSFNDKTTFRAGVGRSFGRVTVTQSSSHFAGFIGQYVFKTPDSGVTPAFYLDQGLPAYPLPPLIDPTFSNNNAVDWFNGQEATRPAVYDNWTVSMQRELRHGLTVELDYNGVYGSDLQANLINPNQVPMSVVNDLIARYGPTGPAIS